MERENELVGKIVYSYIATGGQLKLRVYQITKVYEDSGDTMIIVGSCHHLPLRMIGGTKWFVSEWFTFERNDEQARMVLYGKAKCDLSDFIQSRLDEIERVRKNYEKMFETIETSEIVKDEWYWEQYGQTTSSESIQCEERFTEKNEKFLQMVRNVINDEMRFDSDHITIDGWHFFEEIAEGKILEKINKDNLSEEDISMLTKTDIGQYLADAIYEYEQTSPNIRYYEK